MLLTHPRRQFKHKEIHSMFKYSRERKGYKQVENRLKETHCSPRVSHDKLNISLLSAPPLGDNGRDILLRTQREMKGVVSGMKTALPSNSHSKHCPGPLKFPFGSVATREIEQNRQRIVLSQLPAGTQPEGSNMLLNMNYSLFHPGIFFQMGSDFIVAQKRHSSNDKKQVQLC